MVLDSFFNAIFGGLIAWSPLGALLIISLIMSTLVTLIYKWVTDQDLMKSLKGEIKELQKQLKEFASDPEKVKEIQKPLKDKTMLQLKQSMKPTLYTFIPFIILFTWLKVVYDAPGGLIWGINWIIVYIVASVIFGTITRKLFRVH